MIRTSRGSTRISTGSSHIHSLYTKPLSSLISESSVGHHLYADDTQLFFSFALLSLFVTSEYFANSVRLQTAIDLVSQSMSSNLLSLNQSKTELLIGLPAQLANCLTFLFSCHLITLLNQLTQHTILRRYSRFYTLLMSDHISSVSKSCLSRFL